MVGLKTIVRTFLPNPLDRMLKKAKQKNKKHFLFAWNRGLGDIPLSLFGMVERTKELFPDAEISFIIRENLKEGFLMLDGLKEVIIAPKWKRHAPYDVKQTLKELNIDEKQFDHIIEWPDPEYWVKWQKGKLIPKLKWQSSFDALCDRFNLDKKSYFIGVQPFVESGYNLWRDLPFTFWEEVFNKLTAHKNVKILLLGFDKKPCFNNKKIVDLRGETSVLEALSIIKNRCSTMILPDSGILTMLYYINASFPMKIVSLWGTNKLGVVGQKVPSPNPQLQHFPIVREDRNLQNISPQEILKIVDQWI